MKILKVLIISLLLAFTFASCGGSGGGGGGSDFVGAAEVSLSIRPTKIDIGDTTQLSIDISSVHENGILLKIRYPKNLVYVTDSALLKVDGSDIIVSPGNENNSHSLTYLVFFLSRDIFADSNEGVLTLELRGTGGVKDSEIEIDADVNNPSIPDSSEFNVEKPQFETQDSGGIQVSS